MEKQPDKFEVLIDWFLSDAKEINDKQQNLLELLNKITEQLESEGKDISASSNQLNNQLVEQYRSLISAYKDEKTDREKFKSHIKEILHEGSNSLTRNVLIGCFAVSVIGSLIGACIAHYL